MQNEIEELVPAPKAAAEIGVTRRTINRYINDPKMDFPETVVINGRVYARRQRWEIWKRSRTPKISVTIAEARA